VGSACYINKEENNTVFAFPFSTNGYQPTSSQAPNKRAIELRSGSNRSKSIINNDRDSTARRRLSLLRIDRTIEGNQD
jgi:hypothetical protein